MRIFYVTYAKVPTRKAHGLQIMKTCEAFSAAGAEVSLWLPYRDEDLTQDPFEYYAVKKNFRIHHLPGVDLYSYKWIPAALAFRIHTVVFSSLAALRFLLKRSDGIFYSRDYFTLFLFSLLGFSPIAEIHDYRSSRGKWPIGFILRKAKRIILNSQGTFEALKKHYKLNGDKILVAPNGVDAGFFDIEESKEEARKLLGIPADKFTFSYIGRLETVGTEKGIPDLLRAFASLVHGRGDCLLYIIGGPPVLVEKYREEVQKLGVEEKVTFTGFQEYSKIPLYLRAVDFVTIPLPRTKHAETTSPIKLFEYMAAGKVIITSDLPTIRQYLNDGNAIFFEPENVESLKGKLNFAASNPELVSKLAEQALEDSRKYSWLNRAHRILNFIP